MNTLALIRSEWNLTGSQVVISVPAPSRDSSGIGVQVKRIYVIYVDNLSAECLCPDALIGRVHAKD